MGPCTVLYAEDEANDVLFLELAFKSAGSPHILSAVPDGEMAMAYLAGEEPFSNRSLHPFPALILLDINLPKKTGLEVLEWVRRQPRFRDLPAVMLTSSERLEDMEKARELGADDYLFKPSDPLRLVEVVKRIHERWLPDPGLAGCH